MVYTKLVIYLYGQFVQIKSSKTCLLSKERYENPEKVEPMPGRNTATKYLYSLEIGIFTDLLGYGVGDKYISRALHQKKVSITRTSNCTPFYLRMQSRVSVLGIYFLHNTPHIYRMFSNRRHIDSIRYGLKWSYLWAVLVLRISTIKFWFGPTQYKRISINWTEIFQHRVILLNYKTLLMSFNEVSIVLFSFVD